MSALIPLTSRDNSSLKLIRRLVGDPGAARRLGWVWLEGDHLARAYVARGGVPEMAFFLEEKSPLAHINIEFNAIKNYVLSAAIMREVCSLDTPPNMGLLVRMPSPSTLDAASATVVLDRLQDAGNVGSILRTAAAMGFRQVLALKGTAALWSAKVLRAGMGAHFGLSLLEGLDADDCGALRVPLLVTACHEGHWIHRRELPWPCAWVFGHEGQGTSDRLIAQADALIRIAQPGGEESLNVAAAAAICLHASAPKP
jgi:TrmH family RNA methyltransferase